MGRFLAIAAILALPVLHAQSATPGATSDAGINANLAELKKRAAAGDRPSQYSLGEDYRLGLAGVDPDGKESEHYYKMAAEQGMPEAQQALAMLYFEGEMIPQNYPEALRWFRAAADQGLPESKFYIGVIYDGGLGVPRDYQEAVKWYKITADLKMADGEYNLGIMYLNGFGVDKNYAEAARLFRAAADQRRMPTRSSTSAYCMTTAKASRRIT